MANQPLAIAELGLGGILVYSAVQKIPLSEVLKHGGQGAKTPSPGSTGAKEAEAAGAKTVGEAFQSGNNQAATEVGDRDVAKIKASSSAGVKERAVLEAFKEIGTPYVWADEKEKAGFDCSSLTAWAYEKVGVKLTANAQAQYNETTHSSKAQVGALAFFSDGSEISHVGIVLQEGLMIDAPETGQDIQIQEIPTKIGEKYGELTFEGYGIP